jgi:hypothetical protein
VSNILINCPQCQKGYRIDSSHIGETRNCKKCSAQFTVLASPNQSTDRERLVKSRSETRHKKIFNTNINKNVQKQWLDGVRGRIVFFKSFIFIILVSLFFCFFIVVTIMNPDGLYALTTQEIVALGNKGPTAKESLPELIKALSSKSEINRNEAVTALDKIDPEWRSSEPAQTRYSDLIKDFNWNYGAIFTLDKISPEWRNCKEIKEAIPFLINVVQLSRTAVEASVYEKLQNSNKYIYTAHLRPRLAEIALLEIGSATVPYLIDELLVSKPSKAIILQNLLDGIDPEWVNSGFAENTIHKFKETLTNSTEPTIPVGLVIFLKKKNRNWKTSEADVPILINTLVAARSFPAQKELLSVLNKKHPNWKNTDTAKASIPKLIAVYGNEVYTTYEDGHIVKEDKFSVESTLIIIDPKWNHSNAARNAVPKLLEGLYAAHYVAASQGFLDVIEKIDPDWRARDDVITEVPKLINEIIETRDSGNALVLIRTLNQINPEWGAQIPTANVISRLTSELIRRISSSGNFDSRSYALCQIEQMAFYNVLEKIDTHWETHKNAHGIILKLKALLRTSKDPDEKEKLLDSLNQIDPDWKNYKKNQPTIY